MFCPFSDREVEYVASLLEERVEAWSSSWPFKDRRTIDFPVSYWDIPKTDEKYNLKERDVLKVTETDKSIVLSIPNKEQRKNLPYVIYTLSRHESEAGYGTQKIRCNRIVVGDCCSSDNIVLKKDFPYFDFAKGELEDAKVWNIYKENPGWVKLSDEFNIWKGITRYSLDIFDDCEWNAVIVPKEVIHTDIPRSAFNWLSKQIGKKVSLDNFGEEVGMFFPKGVGLHQLEIQKYKPKKEKVAGKKIKTDAYLGIYGTALFDRTYPGGAYFNNGKFIVGGIGSDDGVTNVEDFKKAITKYFNFPTYELFEVFFCVSGLPKSFREAVKDIL